MNYYELVLAKLNRLDSLSGKAKIPELKVFLEDPYFVSICKMAVDPMRTFGVREFAAINPDPNAELPNLSEFEGLMLELETRQTTGNAAKGLLVSLNLRGVPTELLRRIVRKDLRCGLGADSFNKVQKGFVKVFKVALAEEYIAEAIKFPLLVSPKYDGLRCIVIISGDTVQFLSRDGNSFPALDVHAQRWLDLKAGDMVYDTEVVDGSFFTSLGVKKKKGKAENAVFHTFDVLTLEEFTSRLTITTQKARLSSLRGILDSATPDFHIQYAPHAFCANNEVVMGLYDEYRRLGLEGAIVKDPEAPYQFRRSKAWTKLKDEKTFDLPLLDVEEGQGRLVGSMGRLTVKINERRDGVGTGFSDDERDFFWKNRFVIRTAAAQGEPWIVEIACHELTPDGSMRHSRFKKIRIDKSVADGQGV